VSKIETGRFSDLLRRALSMVGQTEVATELSPEVSPTWQVEGAFEEWMFLKGVKICSVSESIAANVGAGGQMVLRNPPTSGALAVVDGLRMSLTNAGGQLVITVQVNTGDLVNTALTVARDLRWPASPTGSQAAMIATFQNAVGAVPVGAGTIYVGRTLANSPFNYRVPIVLPPGSRLYIGCTSANVPFLASIDWHERGIEPLEL